MTVPPKSSDTHPVPVARRALILGARSAIAQAIADGLARQGWDLVLAARRSDRLEPVAADVQRAG